MANEESYPVPKRPYSFPEIVQRALDDPGFAQFIHTENMKARGGDREAGARLDRYFRPLPDDLAALSLPEQSWDVIIMTNPTTRVLLDFMAHVPPRN